MKADSSTPLLESNQSLDEVREKKRWRSIYLMYLTMFISSCAFSICISAIWPYLKEIDKQSTETYLGWVVASFSIGQLVASPILGFIQTKVKRALPPLILSLVFSIAGNVLYCYIQDISPPFIGSVCLLVSRVLMGLGSGNVAVCRAYVSGATTMAERTSVMAILSASQAVGFILGPGFQAAFYPIGYPGPINSNYFHLDMYTAAGIFGIVVSLINMILLLFLFEEHQAPDRTKKTLRVIAPNIPRYDVPSPSSSTSIVQSNLYGSLNDSLLDTSHSHDNASVSHAAPVDSDERPRADYCAIMSLIAVFYIVLFIFALLETIATPMAMDEYTWKKDDATFYMGIFLAIAGFVSVAVLILVRFLAKIFRERYILLIGFLLMVMGYTIMLPWGNETATVQIISLKNSTTSVSRHISYDEALTISQQLSGPFSWHYRSTDSLLLSKGTQLIGNISGVGCSVVEKPWCLDQPKVRLWQFLVGNAVVSIGYPIGNMLTFTIFSKLIGGMPQGLWMGCLTSFGSLSRILAPIFVTVIYKSFGPRYMIAAVISILLIGVVILLSILQRLVPYDNIRPLADQHVTNSNGAVANDSLSVPDFSTS